eukprot:1362356-Karenia_brevis.AAC.1
MQAQFGHSQEPLFSTLDPQQCGHAATAGHASALFEATTALLGHASPVLNDAVALEHIAADKSFSTKLIHRDVAVGAASAAAALASLSFDL